MFTLENKFKKGDKVKFKDGEEIFKGFKGTVFSPYGDEHVIVDFNELDNAHSHFWDDNDTNNLRLHRVHTNMLEVWKE